MKIRCLMGCAAALLLSVPGVHAGQVDNLTTFTAHTPAKADEVNANFNAVKAAVDDNNSEIGNHEVRIKDVEDKINGSVGFLPGALMDQRKGNVRNVLSSVPPSPSYVGFLNDELGNKTGFVEVVANYTPTLNARAFVQTRCSFDGNSANQILEHRVAIRDPNNVIVGDQLYLRSMTPDANMSVHNVNSDYFNLDANISYDFGVHFANPTPQGGTNEDDCSVIVMIFRR